MSTRKTASADTADTADDKKAAAAAKTADPKVEDPKAEDPKATTAKASPAEAKADPKPAEAETATAEIEEPAAPMPLHFDVEHFVIVSKKDGFRRCGIAHPATPVRHRVADFTEGQLRTLDADPMLIVTPTPLTTD